MKKRLQVKIGDQWQYVFCRVVGKADPLTTPDKRKALPGIDLEYFVRHFSNHEFRTITN